MCDMNTKLCPIKVNSNTIELIVYTSCFWVLDLLCVGMHVEMNLTKNLSVQSSTFGIGSHKTFFFPFIFLVRQKLIPNDV